MSLFKPGPPGPTALHPLQRVPCKLLVKTPSEYTYSLFWAELSRLLGEQIPVAIVGLEPGTYGLLSSTLNTWPPNTPTGTTEYTTRAGNL